MFLAYWLCRKAGYRATRRATFRELVRSFRDAFWGLLMPLIILGVYMEVSLHLLKLQ